MLKNKRQELRLGRAEIITVKSNVKPYQEETFSLVAVKIMHVLHIPLIGFQM